MSDADILARVATREAREKRQKEIERRRQKLAENFSCSSKPVFLSHLQEFKLEELDARTVCLLRDDAKVWIKSFNAFFKKFKYLECHPDFQELKIGESEAFKKACEFIRLTRPMTSAKPPARSLLLGKGDRA